MAVLERPAETANNPIIYDLVANVTHESTAGTTRDKESTVWKVHLRAGRGEREQWLQLQDMIVEEIRKEMIFLGETVMQVGILLMDSVGKTKGDLQIWELSPRTGGVAKGKEKA